MKDEQIKQIVDRFLQWRLPEDFNPDCGIAFNRQIGSHTYIPVGTNLFSAEQAENMVRFMLDGITAASKPDAEGLVFALEMITASDGAPETIQVLAKEALAQWRGGE